MEMEELSEEDLEIIKHLKRLGYSFNRLSSKK
jgi:hypothetical protein